jgi:hypothetical protein
MPVRIYSLQLSEASLSVLHGLVGRAVHRVYAPCLQVDKRHLTAPSISIPTSDETKDGWVHRYVIVRCEWFETPETRTDYWQLFVDNEDKPSESLGSDEIITQPTATETLAEVFRRSP